MKRFRSFADIHTYLNSLMPETRSRREAYTLDNMRELMAFLGNPQNSYKTIHVAGTSGKSSTCYYLSSLIGASGQKVGLGISPHVDEVNERVQINNLPLSEERFCQEFSLFVQKIQPSGIQPTYFELLVAFAFWEFAREKVDYAVIEVGLGGLLDGTNVISRPDKICVITDIGYDHTTTLGKTLSAIATQKAGIIHPGNTVFSYRQADQIVDVLRRTCSENQATLHEISPQNVPGPIPLFQQRNWQLAHAAYDFLAKRDSLPKLTEQQLADTTKIHIPARMEIFQLGGKTIVLDGAHNSQKLEALVKSVKHSYPDHPIACLVSFVRISENKVNDNLAALLPLNAHFIITSFHDDAAEHHSADPATVAKQCQALGYQSYETVPDAQRALLTLLDRPEPTLLITGSFFLLQQIRPLIMHTYDTAHRGS